MGASPRDPQFSTVQVDEAFSAEDDRFVELLRTVPAPKYLAALTDRWKKDPRPWARQQIFKYLAMPLDRPGHHPVVKRLFKQAEANADHELMAAFLVAFDRLVRRQRRIRYTWDFQTRESRRAEELFSPHNQILPPRGREFINPNTGARVFIPPSPRIPKGGRLFTYKTRRYLRRRVWRYFRRLGFQRPADYPQAVAAALARYQDADLAKGENILDSWSLMHIAFRCSPVVRFSRTRVEPAEGRSLGELVAAPQFGNLWKEPPTAGVLFKLVTDGNARLVRVWAMQLLKRDHLAATQEITAEQLLVLLDHTDEEVQQFGASLLNTLTALDSWPIGTWLRLLETSSMTALATICQAMEQRVKPERLDLAQCVNLACARATPVARLGLAWLKQRPVTNPEDCAVISRLADVQCEAIGADATSYALAILGAAQTYQMEDVILFFDSLSPQVRRGAWDWLTPHSPGYDDAALWSRLLETPYDDVRLRLVDELNQRAGKVSSPSALRRQDLAAVWTTVLLGVHRGGRAKLKALRQISQAIAEQSERAQQLVPVLAVAIRSVRPAEARAGLSAILTAVSARPELEAVLAERIPELRLTPSGAVP